MYSNVIRCGAFRGSALRQLSRARNHLILLLENNLPDILASKLFLLS